MLLTKNWVVPIDRPKDDVYSYLLDHFGDPWDLGEMTSLTPGPMDVGSRYRQVGDVRWGVREPSGVLQIDRLQPPHVLAFSWQVDVPARLDTGAGFSTFGNVFPSLGRGSLASIQMHLLDAGPSRTALFILGRNELSRSAAALSILTRWVAYRMIDNRLRAFKDAIEGRSDAPSRSAS